MEQQEKRQRGHSRGILINRCLILILMLATAAGSWYFQTEMDLLTKRLSQDERHIAALQITVAHHAAVIDKFNHTVSNEDVLKQLLALGAKVRESQERVEEELNATEKAISKELNETLDVLDQSVVSAKEKIKKEVGQVKTKVASYIRNTNTQLGIQNHFMIYQLAGTFCLLACLISMWHMTSHLRNFHEPMIQRKVLAILWMVPIYATTSWFSLVFPSVEGYLALIKDFYESWLIYQFLSFCIAALGRGDRAKVIELLASHAPDHLSPPYRFDFLWNKKPYSSNEAMAEAVLMQCQAFAMQFVFFRPATSIALFVFEKLHIDHDNALDWKSPQPYLLGIQNISICIAFAGLLKFYHAVYKDLLWCRPFAKFLCIKGVVFMTFWQGLAISVLARTTVSAAKRSQWAQSAQNFLVCLEMLLFAIAHYYTYPTQEWKEGYREEQEKKNKMALGDSVALGDFVSDLKLIVR